MKATHNRARISPRKTRLVADMIRGQSVSRAKDILDFSDKRAAVYVAKVLRSAEANALQREGVDATRLVVQRIQVNEGPRWKVLFPRPRGTGATMTRPTCHIEVELAEAAPAPRRKKGTDAPPAAAPDKDKEGT